MSRDSSVGAGETEHVRTGPREGWPLCTCMTDLRSQCPQHGRLHPGVRAYLCDWCSVEELERWLESDSIGRTPLVTDAAIFAERPDLLRALGGFPNG